MGQEKTKYVFDGEAVVKVAEGQDAGFETFDRWDDAKREGLSVLGRKMDALAAESAGHFEAMTRLDAKIGDIRRAMLRLRDSSEDGLEERARVRHAILSVKEGTDVAAGIRKALAIGFGGANFWTESAADVIGSLAAACLGQEGGDVDKATDLMFLVLKSPRDGANRMIMPGCWTIDGKTVGDKVAAGVWAAVRHAALDGHVGPADR